MDRNQLTWLQQLVWRRFIVISGLLAFFAGNDFLRVSGDLVAEPIWQPAVGHVVLANGLFVFFVLSALGWIVGSLVGVKSLSRRPELREMIEKKWWAVPILIQTGGFGLHWLMGTIFIVLTGQVSRGAGLGLLGMLHILVVLLIGPFFAR